MPRSNRPWRAKLERGRALGSIRCPRAGSPLGRTVTHLRAAGSRAGIRAARSILIIDVEPPSEVSRIGCVAWQILLDILEMRHDQRHGVTSRASWDQPARAERALGVVESTRR